jgi:hypothetical protein
MIGSRKITPPRMLRIVPFGLFRGDGGAFDADAGRLDGVRRVDRHLVVGRVAMLDRKVEILEFDVEIRVDELVADELPDDAGHLVAVELDDGVLHFDLGHRRLSGVCGGAGAEAGRIASPPRRSNFCFRRRRASFLPGGGKRRRALRSRTRAARA